MIGTNTCATGGRIDQGNERPTETANQPKRRLGDVKEVAKITSLSEKTIRRMCDAGKLPGVVRLCRLLRFNLDVINCWIDQGCPPLHRFSPTGGH